MRPLLALLLASPLVACSADDDARPCNPSFQPVDTTRSCLLPLLAQPCYETVGPPAMVCSVAPDGKVYLSRDGRQYPGARPCTSDEAAKYLPLTDCK